MIRRGVIALLLSLVALAALVGAEVLLALRREYLPTEPALDVSGSFGRPGSPELRFAVFGDSTSVGVGADDAASAYPTLLARRLSQEGRRVELRTFGRSGARVRDVLEEQLPAALAWAPDVAFVGIGANDAIHLTPLGTVTEDMGRILDELKDHGVGVVVAGAPDMRAAAFHEPLRSIVGWHGRRVTDAVAAAARPRGVPVVPLAQEAGPRFQTEPRRMLSDDLFHPSSDGYALWAEVIAPHLLELVESRSAS